MFTRRELLSRAGGGMGMLALSSLLRDNNAVSSPVVHQPTQKAKSVIWLFMNGGPSGIDLFDPKPLLTKLDGKPFPGKLRTLFPYPGNIMKSPFEFKQHGESGHHVSSVFPHVAKHVDDITFLNACVSNEQNHVPACYVVNTGPQQVGSPNLGSWATYGLANESRELPFEPANDFRQHRMFCSSNGPCYAEQENVQFMHVRTPLHRPKLPCHT